MSFPERILKFITCIIVVAYCAQCNRRLDESKGDTDKGGGLEATCYSHVQSRDTISLIIQSHQHQVSGRLEFRFFEKDKNVGTIDGKKSGDTLFALYTFTSEGITSYREVAFLKSENAYLLGYGEVISREGKEVFVNRREIKFDDRVILKEIDCTE